MQIYALGTILGTNAVETLAAKAAKTYISQASIAVYYCYPRAEMVISSRSLFNLFLPYECMHIVLSFIGVILQSGSGVFSQRVYIVHD